MGRVCGSQVAICSAVNMVDWVGAELGGGGGEEGDNCNNYNHQEGRCYQRGTTSPSLRIPTL